MRRRVRSSADRDSWTARVTGRATAMQWRPPRRTRPTFRGSPTLLAILLAFAVACTSRDRPVVIAGVNFGTTDDARVPVFLAAGYVEGSLHATRDGVDVSGAFTRTLWGVLGSVPLGGPGAHRLEVTARFATSTGEQSHSDARVVGVPVRAPALIAATPSRGAANVPRTTWLRLEFASAVSPAARDAFSLRCLDAGGERAHAMRVHALTPAVLVLNPDGDLPSAALCVLGWQGPTDAETLLFSTAAVGAPAHAIYDRTDAGRTTPFPDDFWTRPDATTSTGLRVDMPVPLRASDVQEVFSSLLPETHALDGFSPLAHIVIELDAMPDPASLPRTPAESTDPLGTIGLFDIDPASPAFGSRVPFRIDVRDDVTPSGLRAFTLLLFPSIPLEPGGRYGLVITTRALVDPTRPLLPSAFFAAVAGPPSPGEPAVVHALRPLTDEVLDAVATSATLPIPRDDVALALRISVRTLDTVPSDLLTIRNDVFGTVAPEVTLTSVTPEPASSAVAAVVRGMFAAPDYRGDGVHLQRNALGRPMRVHTRPVEFTLALPRASLAGPAPLVIYQHGNPGSQSEVVSEARGYLAAAGFAVIGFTDILNREIAPPGSGDATTRMTAQVANILFSLLAFDRLPDYWVETHAEQIAFLRILESIALHPQMRDLVPVGAPDGIVDLDVTAPIGYVGISEGANNGPGLLSYAPEIRAAALVVGGARLVEVLLHQQAATFLTALPAFFPNLTPADVWVGLSLFQILYDVQDSHNHARFLYREPVPIGGSARRASVVVTEGVDDSLVPNAATESLAFAFGPIPHLEPVRRAVPFLAPAAGPIAGNIDADTTAAFFQFVPDGVSGLAATPGCLALGLTSRFEGHYCAQDAGEAIAQRIHFLRSALTGAPEIIDPGTP